MKIINKQKILLKKYTKYILLTLISLNNIIFGMDNSSEKDEKDEKNLFWDNLFEDTRDTIIEVDNSQKKKEIKSIVKIDNPRINPSQEIDPNISYEEKFRRSIPQSVLNICYEQKLVKKIIYLPLLEIHNSLTNLSLTYKLMIKRKYGNLENNPYSNSIRNINNIAFTLKTTLSRTIYNFYHPIMLYTFGYRELLEHNTQEEKKTYSTIFDKNLFKDILKKISDIYYYILSEAKETSIDEKNNLIHTLNNKVLQVYKNMQKYLLSIERYMTLKFERALWDTSNNIKLLIKIDNYREEIANFKNKIIKEKEYFKEEIKNNIKEEINEESEEEIQEESEEEAKRQYMIKQKNKKIEDFKAKTIKDKTIIEGTTESFKVEKQKEGQIEEQISEIEKYIKKEEGQIPERYNEKEEEQIEEESEEEIQEESEEQIEEESEEESEEEIQEESEEEIPEIERHKKEENFQEKTTKDATIIKITTEGFKVEKQKKGQISERKRYNYKTEEEQISERERHKKENFQEKTVENKIIIERTTEGFKEEEQIEGQISEIERKAIKKEEEQIPERYNEKEENFQEKTVENKIIIERTTEGFKVEKQKKGQISERKRYNYKTEEQILERKRYNYKI